LVLQNHIQKVCRGDFSSSGLRVRETDEFQDLVSTYNYLYLSLKQKALKDIDTLRKIEPNATDRVAHTHWKGLIIEREKQIAHLEGRLDPLTYRAATEKKSPASRRVS